MLQKNNRAKKADIVGERLKSHSGRPSHMGRIFRRDGMAVSKYLKCCLCPPGREDQWRQVSKKRKNFLTNNCPIIFRRSQFLL